MAGFTQEDKFSRLNSHTDFIFSIIGEELGLVGVTAILALYGLILHTGTRIARQADTFFGAVTATGITLYLGLQVIINTGVTLGVLPTKGLTLPFISYGGTSLIINMAAMGILMNIGASANHAPKNKHVIIAGGKTGGHLSRHCGSPGPDGKRPVDKNPFVGTSAPFETDTLARYGFAHKSIIARSGKREKNIFAKAWSASLVGISLFQALVIIIAFRTDFILGVGGFSSFALGAGWRIIFRDTAIHEQNAFPGMTNRMLSKIARTRFISFKETKGMPEK